VPASWGSLLGSDPSGEQIWEVSPHGTTELLASGVDWGASGAEGWDPCSPYVTSLFDDVLFGVGVGVPGATAPGQD